MLQFLQKKHDTKTFAGLSFKLKSVFTDRSQTSGYNCHVKVLTLQSSDILIIHWQISLQDVPVLKQHLEK